MPMNEQPPWGKKKKPNPTEDFLAQVIQKIRDFFEKQNVERGAEPPGEGPPGQAGPQKPSQSPLKGGGMFFSLIAAAFAIQIALSAFFTIAPGEVGVVLRFGQYHRTTNPGLHFKLPYIEQLAKVNVEVVRKEEFGFRSRGPGATSNIDRKGYDVESLMLTGDKNVIEMAWIVQYQVSDPVNFLFKVRDVPQAVRDASEMVVRQDLHQSVGFSTAVFAAIGLLSGLQEQHSRWALFKLLVPIGAGIGLLAMLGTGGERTDLGAHLFGFVCGLMIGLVYRFSRVAKALHGRVIQHLAFALAGALVLTAWFLARQ